MYRLLLKKIKHVLQYNCIGKHVCFKHVCTHIVLTGVEFSHYRDVNSNSFPPFVTFCNLMVKNVTRILTEGYLAVAHFAVGNFTVRTFQHVEISQARVITVWTSHHEDISHEVLFAVEL